MQVLGSVKGQTSTGVVSEKDVDPVLRELDPTAAIPSPKFKDVDMVRVPFMVRIWLYELPSNVEQAEAVSTVQAGDVAFMITASADVA